VPESISPMPIVQSIKPNIAIPELIKPSRQPETLKGEIITDPILLKGIADIKANNPKDKQRDLINGLKANYNNPKYLKEETISESVSSSIKEEKPSVEEPVSESLPKETITDPLYLQEIEIIKASNTENIEELNKSVLESNNFVLIK